MARPQPPTWHLPRVLGAQGPGGVPDTVRSSIIEADPTLCSGVDLLVEVEGILHRDSPNLTLYIIYTSVQTKAQQSANQSTRTALTKVFYVYRVLSFLKALCRQIKIK